MRDLHVTCADCPSEAMEFALKTNYGQIKVELPDGGTVYLNADKAERLVRWLTDAVAILRGVSEPEVI